MSASNPYCEALGIPVPRVGSVVDHREAGPYSLLIVALLEEGGPLGLEDVAGRLAAADWKPKAKALASLKKCRPAKPPVYREGELYHLDPWDDETDLWVSRLGLRPPRSRPRAPEREEDEAAWWRRQREAERREEAKLATLRRGVVRAFPVEDPAVVAVLDATARTLEIFVSDNFLSDDFLSDDLLSDTEKGTEAEAAGAAVDGDLDAARTRVLELDWIAAERVHATLTGLGIDPRPLRLGELGPPQKTVTTSSGRAMPLSTDLLVRTTCDVRLHLGREATLERELARGRVDSVARRLAADVVLLEAMRGYGQLHGMVRARSGRYDELIPVPWRLVDGSQLHDLRERAVDERREVEVLFEPVVCGVLLDDLLGRLLYEPARSRRGEAKTTSSDEPSLRRALGRLEGDDAWQFARRCFSEPVGRWEVQLFFLNGQRVDGWSVQAARLRPERPRPRPVEGSLATTWGSADAGSRAEGDDSETVH